MSDEPKPRSGRRYAGRGVGELRTARTGAAVQLPSPDEATLLPDPAAAHDALIARFTVAHRRPLRQGFPVLSGRDIKMFANFITCALRNDLPTIDAYDAAVIWEKWRQSIGELRALLREVRDDDADLDAAQYVAIALDHRSWDVRTSLATAMVRPGEVADRYCPWKADFFTADRLHPEAS